MLGRFSGVCCLGFVLVWIVCCCVFGGVAFGLPGGRVYEQVSPVYKGGYGVGGLSMVSADGERVAFISLGVFAGVQWDVLTPTYLAGRVDGVGWSTSSLQPPPEWEVGDFSPGLEYALAGGRTGQSKYGGQGTGFEYLLHRVGLLDTAASWESFGERLVSVDGKPFEGLEFGSSQDMCHLILGATDPLTVEAVGTVGQMYDLSRGCDGTERYLRAVALDNAGEVINPGCKVDLGVELLYEGTAAMGEGQESSFNTVVDGSMVFFTTSVEGNCVGHQVFVRLGGERTVEVSRPLGEVCGDVPCPGALARPSAYFKGASEDGSRVFFTTRASLVGGDVDTGNDLYLASLGCGEGEVGCGVAERRVVSLVQVSHDPVVGQSADVVGVLRIAPDGSRVYFVAHDMLGEGPNAEGRVPVSGADNLYVYDVRTGKTVFVADLCSGPEQSGSTEDAACPASLTGGVGLSARNDSELWGEVQEVSSTRDGGVLVFSSYGRLTEDDADSAKDVYRYDSGTGLMVRVSAGENGYESNGNDEFEASIESGGIKPQDAAHYKFELSSRVVSDDGSRVVFYSSGPLSPRAVNGLQNIYEWHSEDSEVGGVSLLSGGVSSANDLQATISPSGRDVFFMTAEGLVSGDEDGLADVYDARLGGGGFFQAGAARQPCSGDACQGALTNPVPLLVPGSAVQQAGQNFSVQVKKKTVKKRSKRKRVRGKARKRGARTRAGRTGGGRER